MLVHVPYSNIKHNSVRMKASKKSAEFHAIYLVFILFNQSQQ